MAIMIDSYDWKAFEEVAKSVAVKKCKLGLFIEALTNSHKNLVEQALDNPDLAHKTLTKSLMAVGYTGGNTVVRYHRHKECSCFEGSN